MSRRIHCIFPVDPNALNGAARIISGRELSFAGAVRPGTRARRAEEARDLRFAGGRAHDLAAA